MTVRKYLHSHFVFLILGILILTNLNSIAASGVTLYTPYTKIAVSPGQSIDYSIDVINNGSVQESVDVSVTGIPPNWMYSMKSGGWNIKQLSILPGERKSLSLKVDVPYQVNKGSYKIKVNAGDAFSLPLMVIVSEKGTYDTEFVTEQPNMQGNSKSTFTFRASLKNRTAEKQLYALMADLPRGWSIAFQPNYQQATSVEIEPNSVKEVSIEVTPPSEIGAGTYKIPVTASTSNTSAKLHLEVVITGTFNIELATPTGLLSTSITAGEKKRLELNVKNTGSSDLSGIELKSSSPANWEVVFEPQKIEKLAPGSETMIVATVKADKKAIPGDYAMNLEARTLEASSKLAFRITVKTSMLWGWIGVLIIGAALVSVFYLFRKYGRR